MTRKNNNNRTNKVDPNIVDAGNPGVADETLSKSEEVQKVNNPPHGKQAQPEDKSAELNDATSGAKEPVGEVTTASVGDNRNPEVEVVQEDHTKYPLKGGCAHENTEVRNYDSETQKGQLHCKDCGGYIKEYNNKNA